MVNKREGRGKRELNLKSVCSTFIYSHLSAVILKMLHFDLLHVFTISSFKVKVKKSSAMQIWERNLRFSPILTIILAQGN